jgi:hypothetical protein
LWEICKTVHYVGFPFRQLYERMQPLVEKYGTKKVSLAIGELLCFTGWVAALKPETRKACFSVLGPAPETWDSHYRDWQGNPVKRPPGHETVPEVPQPTTDPFLDSLTRLTAEELIAKYKATVRWNTEDDRKAVESEMLRRAIEVPKVEAPKVESKEEPKQEEPPTMVPPETSEGSDLAEELTRESKTDLQLRLLTARRLRDRLAGNPLAEEYVKEAALVEAEMKRRGMEVPAEGETTTRKKRKKA